MLSICNGIYILLISLVLFCDGNVNDNPGKNVVVEKIIEKIFNLTSQSLNNASPNEKEGMMKKIEQKLVKSAEPLGSRADKYIKLVMQGLHIMANNLTSKQSHVSKHSGDALSNLRRSNDSGVVDNHNTKDAAQELAHKILKLAEKYFNRSENSDGDKLKIMKSIKHRVLETAKQKHDLIHAKHDEIKKYTDLISRGMELMMENFTEEPSKRRMVMEFVSQQNDAEENEYMRVKNSRQKIKYKEEDDNFVMTNGVTTINPSNEGLTTPSSCDEMFQHICISIKTLNEFVCKDNGVTLPLLNLCNGIPDCADASDEKDCVNQAMVRLQSATSLMARIENFLLRSCFLTDDNSLLMKQNSVLHDVLQRQIGFIDKYKNMKRNTLELTNAYSFKRTLNEVIMVINTLSLALDSSLCIRYVNEKKADARKFNSFDLEYLDEIAEKPAKRVSLKSCVCKDSFCANAMCPEACSRVCWHKHNIGRWLCQAIDEGTSVPLDTVCDGKLDCYDESDENGCKTGASYGKFEANDVFDQVLKLLTTKSNMNEYLAVKPKLVALGNSILQLQRVAVKPKADVASIKNVRDVCYASITAIYEDIVNKAHDVKELEDTHMFLLTVSERLMSALKQSHTGNDRIITPDGCYCRKDKCAATKCSSSCRRACAVSPKLTKYWCKATVNNNISIPLSSICNGQPNCPFEDDESQCSYDVCRKHHLVLLRHSIRDIGEKHKGTALGEALRSWKAKVLSAVKIAENNYRPTPSTIRDLVGDMLRDLVTMYASMSDTRRTNTDFVLKQFYDISQTMIESLKTCRQ